ncbi:MAG: ABC transporter ATP-binding protein [Firmicutes bacterium]|nr:ABC transporter ATP-binding protein [Bacillota bacterium]
MSNSGDGRSSVEFKSVSKFYGKIKALDNVSLKISEGEFVTIIGTSGCGKTTLLKTVNALVEPEKGTVIVGGTDIKNTNHIKLRRSIGYVIQDVGLFPHMNVMKNIAYVPSLVGRAGKGYGKRDILYLLDAVGLEESLLERYPAELSGGQQQRVGIARALAMKPRILLMDEPFGSVDEITRQKLQDEIISIRQNLDCTILFVTHDIDEAIKLSDRLVIMDRGEIIQVGNAQSISSDPINDYVDRLINRQ